MKTPGSNQMTSTVFGSMAASEVVDCVALVVSASSHLIDNRIQELNVHKGLISAALKRTSSYLLVYVDFDATSVSSVS